MVITFQPSFIIKGLLYGRDKIGPTFGIIDFATNNSYWFHFRFLGRWSFLVVGTRRSMLSPLSLASWEFRLVILNRAYSLHETRCVLQRVHDRFNRLVTTD